MSGGAPVTLAFVPDLRGASWGPDDHIVFTPDNKYGLALVSAAGGEPEVLTSPDRTKNEKSHRFPQVLPGGKAVLFTIGASDVDTFDDAQIAVLSLESGEHKVLLEGGTDARFAASGHLLYARGGDLLAVPFDVDRLEVTGSPVPVVQNVLMSPSYGHAEFSLSGYDVRTGKRLWIFHTIPQPGEFGYDTWENGSADYTGNTGVWSQISVDESLGLAYLPVELPTGDYYGGDRPGANLFSESIVAVDLKTGKRRWHFQLVHHGIWDMDIPCPPILADITVDGRAIKALAQPTKQGFLYVFDRETGEPVWPIEERPVPPGDVPGEWYAPTRSRFRHARRPTTARVFRSTISSTSPRSCGRKPYPSSRGTGSVPSSRRPS